MSAPHQTDVRRSEKRHRMNIWVESLPGKEHQIEQILTQIIKEMFIGLHGAQPHMRHAGRKVSKNRGNAERKCIVVAGRANSARKSSWIQFVVAPQILKHMHEGKHLVITAFGSCGRLHQKPASHKKRIVPIGAELREHAVGARETDAELLGRTRKRSGTEKRQKKIERFSIHAADKGRQTMLVERLERLDGILSVLAFPTKNRFRH